MLPLRTKLTIFEHEASQRINRIHVENQRALSILREETDDLDKNLFKSQQELDSVKKELEMVKKQNEEYARTVNKLESLEENKVNCYTFFFRFS